MRRTIVFGTALWLLMLVGAVGAISAAWLAGWKLDAVRTGSMAPEVPAGSLVVVAPVRPAAIEVGNVVTFGDPGRPDHVVLHRVVEVVGTIDAPMLRTQGDANATADPVLVPARSIEGRLRFASPHLGTLVLALQAPVGPAVLVGAPMLLFLAASLIRRRGHSAPASERSPISVRRRERR